MKTIELIKSNGNRIRLFPFFIAVLASCNSNTSKQTQRISETGKLIQQTEDLANKNNYKRPKSTKADYSIHDTTQNK